MILNAFRKNDEEQQRAQARVDAIVAAARAKSAAAEAPKRNLYRSPELLPLRPSTDLLDQRMQEEIASTRRMVEALGDELSNDPILLMRYQQSLQSIDLMAQILGHLACVIGSADRMEAVERIGMANLKARLTRGMVTDTVAFQRADHNPFA
jgi:hypothetical protein